MSAALEGGMLQDNKHEQQRIDKSHYSSPLTLAAQREPGGSEITVYRRVYWRV